MSKIYNLFFELIQVSLGTRTCLSHTPSVDEWRELYGMAKNQSLVGICFVAVKKLQTIETDRTVDSLNLAEIDYIRWMGMAAKIQQRNEALNLHCIELQSILASNGFLTSILKGQGVASLYGDKLSFLRQSGDIDIYVQGGMQKVLDYCTEKFGKVDWDYINAHAPFYPDTEVELHWKVLAMTNLFTNKRLQKWLIENENCILQGNDAELGLGKIVVPTLEFNAFYILLHCYHHMFESGLGLRQLMDYYFVLMTLSTSSSKNEIYKTTNLRIKQFGMMRFASAVMWIMKDVFGMEDKYLLCEPNEKEGRFILNEVMMNGNFGHHDERKHKIKNKLVAPFATRIQHNWHLATHYPSEFFWAPVWLVYHFIWKRTR